MATTARGLTSDFVGALRFSGPNGLVEAFIPWLALDAGEVDRRLAGPDRAALVGAVASLNRSARDGDADSLYARQFLLTQLYALTMNLPSRASAEGSSAVHEVCGLLEQAVVAAEDARIDAELLAAMPSRPKECISWLKATAREHPAYKHPYYSEFIAHESAERDLRDYVIQESVVDGRFDDLLAMMQIGTRGGAKMEIAGNYWDEMGNGDPARVHTRLFEAMPEVFGVTGTELAGALTAQSLLSGNLAVLLCRYRRHYPEAAGFLGMTEWFAPDRFVHVVNAWTRLGLPEVGIVYHRLHITVDSQHAAGWFHNVLTPAGESAHMRGAIARGALRRLNSSARYLDERLAAARSGVAAAS